MKSLLAPIALLFFLQANAQDCNTMFTSYIKGASFETTHYDATNAVKGKNTSTVTDVKNTSDGKIISLHAASVDNNNKKIGETDITIVCEGNTVKLDFAGAMAHANPMAGKGNFDMKFDKTDIEFPAKPVVGQTIPDDKIVMNIINKSSATVIGTNTINFKNRKVVSKESVTTPAGTFECYKISSDVSMEMNMMGNALPPRVHKSESYVSSSVGIVKAIIYDETGKVTMTSLLTKVNK